MGDTVVRGPDWLVHNSDQSNGGAGQKGTVEKDHQEKGAFYVKWDNGTTDAYRCGYDNLIEIVAVEVTVVRLCYPFLSLSLSLFLSPSPPPSFSLSLPPPLSLCISLPLSASPSGAIKHYRAVSGLPPPFPTMRKLPSAGGRCILL